MKIEDKLLLEHSKNNSIQISAFIGNDLSRFKKLMNLFMSDNKTLAQRASMVIYYCHDTHPQLTDHYLNDFIETLKGPFIHDAIKRTCLRTLRDKVIPEEQLGMVTDQCFKFLNGHDEPVAIKVFSMDILKNVVFRVPELKDELKFSIEEQLPYQSPGFKAHAKMILKEISQI